GRCAAGSVRQTGRSPAVRLKCGYTTGPSNGRRGRTVEAGPAPVRHCRPSAEPLRLRQQPRKPARQPARQEETPMPETPAYRFIAVETVDRVAWLTFNRPEVLNALHPEMLGEVIDAL